MGPSGLCSELIYRFDTSYRGWIKDENIHNYGYIREILVDILTRNINGQKINQTHRNVRKKTLKNDIKSIIDTFKLFFLKKLMHI